MRFIRSYIAFTNLTVPPILITEEYYSTYELCRCSLSVSQAFPHSMAVADKTVLSRQKQALMSLSCWWQHCVDRKLHLSYWVSLTMRIQGGCRITRLVWEDKITFRFSKVFHPFRFQKPFTGLSLSTCRRRFAWRTSCQEKSTKDSRDLL